MKAWMYTLNQLKGAVPVILDEDEQTWTAANDAAKASDASLMLKWESHVPGSGAPECVIAGEIQSMEAMGYDVARAEELFEDGLAALRSGDMNALNAITARLYEALYSAPKLKGHEYCKYKVYSSFADIAGAVDFPPAAAVDTSSADFADRTLAAVQGRLAGGALGTQLEGYASDQLKRKFGPVSFYVRKPNTYNDDITYELAFLAACEGCAGLPSSADIADKWLALIPSGWSAEAVALSNLRRGIYPPESGLFRNGFREWIGAQMRGAICGQVSPGDLKRAAYLAYADAVISHHNNGALGEIFNAAMASLAFVESDIRKIVDAAISLIPSDSEYYAVISFAREECKKGDFGKAQAACEKRLERYNWVHCYPNAAAEVLSLWFGDGDFDETMRLVASCGQDVDCNAAQAGAIIGALGGTRAIGARWTEPFGGTIETYMRGESAFSVDALAKRIVGAAGKILACPFSL